MKVSLTTLRQYLLYCFPGELVSLLLCCHCHHRITAIMRGTRILLCQSRGFGIIRLEPLGFIQSKLCLQVLPFLQPHVLLNHR